MRLSITVILAVLLSVAFITGSEPAKSCRMDQSQMPTGSDLPYIPQWVFEPWVWEDDENTEPVVRQLVQGYIARDIPVGAVIIDSPWETNYNTFLVDESRYPDMRGMIEDLHARDVRVLLWITSLINVSSTDVAETGKASNYDPAFENGYFINNGALYNWWKGTGSFIDYTNPGAVEWWHSQMDLALDLGIDGWKVDAGNRKFPRSAQSFAGTITKKEYSYLFYQDFLKYTREVLGDEAITFVKSFDEKTADSTYVPPEYAPTCWVGDQRHTWGDKGLLNALYNMFLSSDKGYLAVGSDIGGFEGAGGPEKTLFIRWAQLGALCPIMENGGHNDHRPWSFDQETVEIYRYYAKLHSELVPYLYSLAMQGLQTGMPILRPQSGHWQYTLGRDLFVAPLVTPDGRRTLSFPPGSGWIDYWDHDRVFSGGQSMTQSYRLHEYPLFIRQGAILPMHVRDNLTGHGDGSFRDHLTLWIYPQGESSFTWYRDRETPVPIVCHHETDQTEIRIGAGGDRYVVCVVKDQKPAYVNLNSHPMVEMTDAAEFITSSSGWMWKTDEQAVWIRVPPQEKEIDLFISDTGPPTGTITVETNLDEAVFTVSGPQIKTGYGQSWHWNEAPVGSYRVTFEPVAGYHTPLHQTADLSAGDTLVFCARYQPFSRVATPQIQPPSGTYESSVVVTLSCETDHALIYYTLDGRSPDTTSTLYQNPFELNTSSTLKVRAFRSGWNPSEIAGCDYTIISTGAMVIRTNHEEARFNVTGPRAFSGQGQEMIVDDLLPGSYDIVFLPLEGFITPPALTGMIQPGDTLYFTGSYEPRPQAASPFFDPPPGTYADSILVFLTSPDENITIHYTRDGSLPTADSPVYTGPVSITDTTLLKAIAMGPEWRDSEVVTGQYNIASLITRIVKKNEPLGDFLDPVFPNPFHVLTAINYGLAKGSRIQMVIYDMLGQRVTTLANGYQKAGQYTVYWDGTDQKCKQVPSGMYYLNLLIQDKHYSGRMLLLR